MHTLEVDAANLIMFLLHLPMISKSFATSTASKWRAKCMAELDPSKCVNNDRGRIFRNVFFDVNGCNITVIRLA